MSSRFRDLAARRPLTVAVAATLVWHLVLFLVEDLLPPLAPDRFPQLGAAVVNYVLAALTVWLVVWAGWWRSACLAWRGPDRTWLLLLPLLAEALVFALPGITTSTTTLVGLGLMLLGVGVAEETLSRGLVQRVLTPMGPARAAVWVGVLFGLGHALSGFWFGRPWEDVLYIVVAAGIYGFCLAAVRWHVRTVWPLAFLHALTDWTQLASPGNLPFGVRIAIHLALLGYGWWLLRLLARRPAPVLADT